MLREITTQSIRFEPKDVGRLANFRKKVFDVARVIYGKFAYEQIIGDALDGAAITIRQFTDGKFDGSSLEDLFDVTLTQNESGVEVSTRDPILKEEGFYDLLQTYAASSFSRDALKEPYSPHGPTHMESADLGLVIQVSKKLGADGKAKLKDLVGLRRLLQSHRDNPQVNEMYSHILYQMKLLNYKGGFS